MAHQTEWGQWENNNVWENLRSFLGGIDPAVQKRNLPSPGNGAKTKCHVGNRSSASTSFSFVITIIHEPFLKAVRSLVCEYFGGKGAAIRTNSLLNLLVLSM